MILSDLSVQRPVFATVLSLLLVILGVMAFRLLPVRELPDIDPPIVSIETEYRGASADVVETKITQVIEDRVAGLPGLVKLTSSSRDERSDITMEFALDRDVDAAANDVRDRVARVVGNLPEEAEPPEVAKVDADAQPVMWLNLRSERMNTLELTDYAERVLVDRLSTVNGVARVRISGARRYAMRIWLDREALAARGLTVTEVEAALRAENVELPAGRLESQSREFTLRTRTGFETEEDFRQLVVGRGPNGLVRLYEVARVEKGAADERNVARANRVPAISLGIEQQSKANTIEVSDGVRRQMEVVQQTLPEGMALEINYDRAAFIRESVREVYKAFGISLGLVLVVIYLFLGTLRATLIPGVVVPISIMSAFIVMAALGYSLNVLTLLGLVLAIGLVVDDAIVVLENVYRRIEEGEKPLLASLDGSREIAFAVIATTLVLSAVFLPVSYLQGNIGRLFGEFGVTVAAAVLFSGLVALTLTPMMASKLFKGPSARSGFAHFVDETFRRFADRYAAVLRDVVARPTRMIGGIVAVCALAALLFRLLPSEYTPEEDRGVVFATIQGPEGASMQYMDGYLRRMEDIVMEQVERGDAERVLARLPGGFGGGGDVNSARTLLLLAPWSARERSARDIANDIRKELNTLPGVRANVSTPRGLGVRGGDRPVQVVLGGGDYAHVNGAALRLRDWMAERPGFVNPETDFYERKPTMRIVTNRDRAADLGISLSTIGRTLETMLGSRVVTRYVDRGEEYDVILQGEPEDRATPTDLKNLYVRSATSGELVPLANVVTLQEVAGPTELRRFDRLRSITVSSGLASNYPLGRAIRDVENFAKAELPFDVQLRWDGEAREFKSAGGSLYVTFVLALIIVFLVLAAQFESFVHPFVIMMTVPLAVTGALIGLYVWGVSINVYTQIGAILLVGLAAKNGVLIVEFANQLRDRGVAFHEAIVHAAGIRLRPVLMTSLTAVFGAFPLLFAHGAGWEARNAVGVVVVFGVVFATLLTLFVVPAMYALLARGTGSPEDVAKAIEALRETERPAPHHGR